MAFNESALSEPYVSWDEVVSSPTYVGRNNEERLKTFDTWSEYNVAYRKSQLELLPEDKRTSFNTSLQEEQNWVQQKRAELEKRYTIAGLLDSEGLKDTDSGRVIEILRDEEALKAQGFSDNQIKKARDRAWDVYGQAFQFSQSGPLGGMPENDEELKAKFWRQPGIGDTVNSIWNQFAAQSYAVVARTLAGATGVLDKWQRLNESSYEGDSAFTKETTLGNFAQSAEQFAKEVQTGMPMDPRIGRYGSAALAGATQMPAQLMTAPVTALNAVANYGQLFQDNLETFREDHASRIYKDGVESGRIPESVSFDSWKNSLTDEEKADIDGAAAWKAATLAAPQAAIETLTDKFLIGRVPLEGLPGGKVLGSLMSWGRRSTPRLTAAAALFGEGAIKGTVEGTEEVVQDYYKNLVSSGIRGELDSPLDLYTKGFENADVSFIGGFAGGTTATGLMEARGLITKDGGIITQERNAQRAIGLTDKTSEEYKREAADIENIRQQYGEQSLQFRERSANFEAKQDEAHWVLSKLADPKADTTRAQRAEARYEANRTFLTEYAKWAQENNVGANISLAQIESERQTRANGVRETFSRLRETSRNAGLTQVEAEIDDAEQRALDTVNEESSEKAREADEALAEFRGSVDQAGPGRAAYARMVVMKYFPNFSFSQDYKNDDVMIGVLDAIESGEVNRDTNLEEWLGANLGSRVEEGVRTDGQTTTQDQTGGENAAVPAGSTTQPGTEAVGGAGAAAETAPTAEPAPETVAPETSIPAVGDTFNYDGSRGGEAGPRVVTEVSVSEIGEEGSETNPRRTVISFGDRDESGALLFVDPRYSEVKPPAAEVTAQEAAQTTSEAPASAAAPEVTAQEGQSTEPLSVRDAARTKTEEEFIQWLSEEGYELADDPELARASYKGYRAEQATAPTVTEETATDTAPTEAPAPVDIAAITADVEANPKQHSKKVGRTVLISREAAVSALSKIPDGPITRKQALALSKELGISSPRVMRLAELKGNPEANQSLLRGDLDASLLLFDRGAEAPANTERAQTETGQETDVRPGATTTAPAETGAETDNRPAAGEQTPIDLWVTRAIGAIEERVGRLSGKKYNVLKTRLASAEGRAEIQSALAGIYSKSLNEKLEAGGVLDPVTRAEAVERALMGEDSKVGKGRMTKSVLDDLLRNVETTGDPFFVGTGVRYNAYKARGMDVLRRALENQSNRAELDGGTGSVADRTMDDARGGGRVLGGSSGGVMQDVEKAARQAEYGQRRINAVQTAGTAFAEELAGELGTNVEDTKVAVAFMLSKKYGIDLDILQGMGWTAPEGTRVKRNAAKAVNEKSEEIFQRFVARMRSELTEVNAAARAEGLLGSPRPKVGSVSIVDLVESQLEAEATTAEFNQAAQNARSQQSIEPLKPVLSRIAANENFGQAISNAVAVELNGGRALTDPRAIGKMTASDLRKVANSPVLPESMRETLSALADLSGDPMQLLAKSPRKEVRLIAKYLQKKQNQSVAPKEGLLINFALLPQLSTRFTGQGVYLRDQENIHVSPFSDDFELTVLHEEAHVRLNPKIDVFDLDPNSEVLSSADRELLTELDELKDLVQDEANFRIEEAIEKGASALEIAQLRRDLLGGQNNTSIDLREFVNEALNHKPFQKFLAELKSQKEGQSVLKKVINLILGLMLGEKVALDSALQRAFEIAAELSNDTRVALPIEQRNKAQVKFFKEQENLLGRKLSPDEVNDRARLFARLYPQVQSAETLAEAEAIAPEVLSAGELDSFDSVNQSDVVEEEGDPLESPRPVALDPDEEESQQIQTYYENLANNGTDPATGAVTGIGTFRQGYRERYRDLPSDFRATENPVQSSDFPRAVRRRTEETSEAAARSWATILEAIRTARERGGLEVTLLDNDDVPMSDENAASEIMLAFLAGYAERPTLTGGGEPLFRQEDVAEYQRNISTEYKREMGISLPDQLAADLEELTKRIPLVDGLEQIKGAFPRLGAGVTSQVYVDKANASVYKIVQFKRTGNYVTPLPEALWTLDESGNPEGGYMLERAVEDVLDLGPDMYVMPQNNFFDDGGTFINLIASTAFGNGIEGFTFTEIVGVTQFGEVILKQPLLPGAETTGKGLTPDPKFRKMLAQMGLRELGRRANPRGSLQRVAISRTETMEPVLVGALDLHTSNVMAYKGYAKAKTEAASANMMLPGFTAEAPARTRKTTLVSVPDTMASRVLKQGEARFIARLFKDKELLEIANNPNYGQPKDPLRLSELSYGVLQSPRAKVSIDPIPANFVAEVTDAQDGSRVGTSKLGTKAKPQETPQDSNITGENGKVPAELLSKQMAQMNYSHLPKDILTEKNPEVKRRKMIDWFKKNLLALYDAFPEGVRSRATHWYDGANRIARSMEQAYGATVEQASGVIAVFSPQKNWFMNVAQADQFMNIWVNFKEERLEKELVQSEIDAIVKAGQATAKQKRKKPKDREETAQEKAERIAYNKGLDRKVQARRRKLLNKVIGKTIAELDSDDPAGQELQAWAIRVLAQVKFGRTFENLSPEGDLIGLAANDNGKILTNTWGSTLEIQKAVRIMKDGSLRNISENLGQEHKVRNFYNNIAAPNSTFGDVTIDTHAVAAAHLLPFGASATEVKHNLGTGASSDPIGVSGMYHIYYDAYKEAAAERGIQPRQLQSVTWEAIRLLFPAKTKKSSLASRRELWKTLNDDNARSTILDNDGRGIPEPVWAGASNAGESQGVAPRAGEAARREANAGRRVRNSSRSADLQRRQRARRDLSQSPRARVSPAPLPAFQPSVFTADSRKQSEALYRVRNSEDYANIGRALEGKTYFAWSEQETKDKADQYIAQKHGGDLNRAALASDTDPDLTSEQAIMVQAFAAKRSQEAANAARMSAAKLGESAAKATDPATRRSLMVRANNLATVAQVYESDAEILADRLLAKGSDAGQQLRAFRLVADVLVPRQWAGQYKKPIIRAQKKILEGKPITEELLKKLKEARRSAANATAKRMEAALKDASKGFMPKDISDAELQAAENIAKQLASPLPVREQVIRAAVEDSVIQGVETLRRGLAGQTGDTTELLRMWEMRLRQIAQEQLNSELQNRLQAGQVQQPEMTDEEKEQARQRKIDDFWREFSDFPFAETVFNIAQSTIESRATPFAPLVRNLRFDAARSSNLRRAVMSSISIAEEIRKTADDRNITVDVLKRRLAELNPTLTLDQLSKLSKAVEKVYNDEVNKAAKDALSRIVMAASVPEVEKVTEQTTVDRLLPLVNMGAFSEEAVYNAIADKFGLPVWNEAVAEELAGDAKRLQSMPEGSQQRLEASQILTQKILRESIKASKGRERFHHLNSLASSLWTAGVLSGPSTQIVNSSMTAVSVFLESIFDAAGYYRASRKQGLSHAQSVEFFKDMGRAWLFAFGKDAENTSLRAVNEAYAALTKGTTKFKSEKQEDMSPLEIFKFDKRVSKPGMAMMDAIMNKEWKAAASAMKDTSVGIGSVVMERAKNRDAKGAVKDWAATMKLVGRLMLASDAANSMVATTTKQMMMKRFISLTEENMSEAELNKMMSEITRGENQEIKQAALAMAKEEAQRGDFGPEGSKAFEVAKARRVEQLIEQNTYSAEEIASGRDFAALATFNSDPYGLIGFFMMNTFGLMNKTTGLLAKPLNPFPRTSSNLLNAALNYTPYGYLRARGWNLSRGLEDKPFFKEYFREAPKPGSPEYYAATARAAAGTAFLTIMAFAMAGAAEERKRKGKPIFEIFGAGPKDYRVRKQWRDSGGKPFTLVLGPLELNYKDWPGISIPLGMLGTYYDNVVWSDKDMDFGDGIHLILASVIGTTLDRNMLGGASALFDWMSSSTPVATKEAALIKLSTGYASGFLRPSFVRWAETVATGTYQENRTFNGVLLSMTPVISAFRNMPALNILGEPIRVSAWDATAGRVISLRDTHPILSPLTDANVFIPPPQRYPIADRTKEDGVRNMNESEMYQFTKRYGEEIKKALSPSRVSRIVRQAQRDTEAAQDALNELALKARKRAQSRMRSELNLKKGERE